MAPDTQLIVFNTIFHTADPALVFPVDSLCGHSQNIPDEILGAAPKRGGLDDDEYDEDEDEDVEDDEEELDEEEDEEDEEYDDDDDDEEDEDEEEDDLDGDEVEDDDEELNLI